MLLIENGNDQTSAEIMDTHKTLGTVVNKTPVLDALVLGYTTAGNEDLSIM